MGGINVSRVGSMNRYLRGR